MMAAIPVPPPLPPKASFKPDQLNAMQKDSTPLPDPDVEAERLWGAMSANSGIYCLTPVRPVLQSGPTCGLVALDMAMDALGLNHSVAGILSEAQSMGFTRQGEMMSVQHMKQLCEKIFPVTTTLKRSLRNDVPFLLNHLSRGWPVLLPYDCDANFSPVLRKGKRAHWAVVLGFALETDHQSQELTHLRPPLSSDQLELVHSYSSTSSLFLYARQGKSRYLHLWNFDDVCSSNENLLQVSDKLHDFAHVLPSRGDISECLANQVLFIKLDAKLHQ